MSCRRALRRDSLATPTTALVRSRNGVGEIRNAGFMCLAGFKRHGLQTLVTHIISESNKSVRASKVSIPEKQNEPAGQLKSISILFSIHRNNYLTYPCIITRLTAYSTTSFIYFSQPPLTTIFHQFSYYQHINTYLINCFPTII